MERGGGRHVAVAAIGAARRDDADRRLRRLHGADLHRRGVGAQQHAAAVRLLRQVEGVVHLPGGMFRRDVEGGEVVEIVFDVRSLGDGEAHLAEDGDHLVRRLADRMDAALGLRPRRQGHVDRFGGEPRVELGFGEIVPARLDRLGDGGLQRINRLRSEEHTSELQSPMRTSYAVFCLKKKKQRQSITYKKKTARARDFQQIPSKQKLSNKTSINNISAIDLIYDPYTTIHTTVDDIINRLATYEAVRTKPNYLPT